MCSAKQISTIPYLTKHVNTLLHFRWCKWNNKWWFQSTDWLVWERRVAVLFFSALQWFSVSLLNRSLYNSLLAINLSSFSILKPVWNSKKGVYSESYMISKISRATAFESTVLRFVFWRDAAVSHGVVLCYSTSQSTDEVRFLWLAVVRPLEICLTCSYLQLVLFRMGSRECHWESGNKEGAKFQPKFCISVLIKHIRYHSCGGICKQWANKFFDSLIQNQNNCEQHLQ